MRANAGGMRVGRHDHLPEGVPVFLHRLELDRLARAGQGQAGDDGVAIDGELGVRQALVGGVEHGAEAVVQPEAHVGRARHALAEDAARTIAKAGAALRAAAVNSEKKQRLVHLRSSTPTLIYE